MKVVLEGREFNIEANGSFFLRYSRLFHGNLFKDLYSALKERDMLITAQLIFASITPTPEETFEEWLNSFETPFFFFAESQNILEYLMRDATPTVEGKEKEGKKAVAVEEK